MHLESVNKSKMEINVFEFLQNEISWSMLSVKTWWCERVLKISTRTTSGTAVGEVRRLLYLLLFWLHIRLGSRPNYICRLIILEVHFFFLFELCGIHEMLHHSWITSRLDFFLIIFLLCLLCSILMITESYYYLLSLMSTKTSLETWLCCHITTLCVVNSVNTMVCWKMFF